MMTALSRLRLRIMLSLAPFLVNRAAKHSSRLKQLLEAAPGALQVTAGKNPIGFYTVVGGALRWKGGLHPSPSFTQIWKSPQAALRVLTGEHEPDIIGAFAAEQLKMNGDFQTALWFKDVMAIAQSKAAKSPEMIRRDLATE
ncbi:MAG: hypothetical protein ACLPX7_18760 [Xanthobacteraceae bacterium]